jgi:hypothetical protein
MLGISPGAHALIAAVAERRLLRFREEFTAVVMGDPLLALAVAVSIALCPDGASAGIRPVVFGTAEVIVICGWLAFGLWQWRTELCGSYYSRAQAWAPTKIWHQLGVYPLLGMATWCAVLSGMAAPLGHQAPARLVGKAVISCAVAGWIAANVYDRHHPKLGHPPYSWRRLRPLAKPWPTSSETLRVSHLPGTQAPGGPSRDRHPLRPRGGRGGGARLPRR